MKSPLFVLTVYSLLYEGQHFQMTLLQDTVCLPPKENLLEVLVNVITLQVTQSECTGYYYLKYITENTAHKYMKP